MSDYTSFIDDESIDGQIRKLKIEYQAKKRAEKKSYRESLLFHEKMLTKKISHSDRDFILWDIAIVAIRNYRLKHYFAWLEKLERRI